MEVPLRRAGFDLDFWFPSKEPAPSLDSVCGIVSLGGLAAPEDTNGEPWLHDERAVIRDAVTRRIPFLGICLGAQLLALETGGAVQSTSEHGWTRIRNGASAADDPLMRALGGSCDVFQWHDWAFRAPTGAEVLAVSDTAEQVFRVGDSAWGMQFHLELTLAIAGQWMVMSRQTLLEHGVDPDALRSDTAEREDEWLARASRVSAAFARICRGS